MVITFTIYRGDDSAPDIDYDYDIGDPTDDLYDYVREKWGSQAVDFISDVGMESNVLDCLSDDGDFIDFLRERHFDEALEQYEADSDWKETMSELSDWERN